METQAHYARIGLFAAAVLVAAFFAIYWLENRGEPSDAMVLQIRYGSPVSGLQRGAAVLFNGLRVGTVTDLGFDPDNPRDVVATVSLARQAPVRADTKAGIERQGLLGSASVSLTGGTDAAPLQPGRAGGPAVLAADPAASEDLTQAARETVQSIAKLVGDNADPLHAALTNISQFSEALARNATRLDSIMAGLERLTGGGPPKPKPEVYDLTAPTGLSLAKIPTGQLVVADPVVPVTLDTQRVLPQADGEDASAATAQWTDSIPKLVQSKIVEAFENANYLRVGRPTDGLTADDQLLIEIRRFDVSTTPEPTATVAFTAKLLGNAGVIADARVFRANIPVKGQGAAASAAALDQAFGQVASDLVTWVSGVM